MGLVKKRGRQKRKGGNVSVSGKGRFKVPRNPAWYKIPSGGVDVPAGTLVKTPERKKATVGGKKMTGGSMLQVRKQKKATKPKRRKIGKREAMGLNKRVRSRAV